MGVVMGFRPPFWEPGLGAVWWGGGVWGWGGLGVGGFSGQYSREWRQRDHMNGLNE